MFDLSLTVTSMTALIAGIWALLTHFSSEIRNNLDALQQSVSDQILQLKDAIDERFRLTEENRTQASDHWKQLFQELQRRSEQGLERYEALRGEYNQLRLQLMEYQARMDRFELILQRLPDAQVSSPRDPA